MRFATLVTSVFLALAAVSTAWAEEKIVPESKAQITLSFAPIVKTTAPAVVNIFTRARVQVRETVSPLMNDPFFQQFFGGNAALAGRTREQVVSSLGSGVIVKADGVVVTSYHVIKDAEEINVVLSDKREFNATVIARDPQSDLAFLRIKSDTPLPHLEMRDSDSLEVGDMVLAIGNPFGVGQTVTSGIISGLARKAAGVSDYQFFIQTDAAINPGNSGGALVDMGGKLIGINTAIYSKSGGYQGIGFAIPSNMIASLLGSKLEKGRVVRPWIGLSVQPVTAEIAESLGLTSPKGVIIRRVVADSPAEKSGLKVGDVVVSVNGTEVSTDQEMIYRVALVHIGDKSEFQVLRSGVLLPITMEMVPPPESPPRDLHKLVGRHPFDGITVGNLSPALAIEIGMDDSTQSGVVVLQVGAGLGRNVSLKPGDVIVEVNGQKITTTSQLDALMKKTAQQWQIVFLRGGKTQTLTVRL